MAPQIPDREPSQIVGGDTALWTRTIADYPPADGWALHYKLVEPSGGVAPATQPVVTVVSNYYSVVLAAAALAGVVATNAVYRLIGYVDGVGGERHTVYDDYVQVLPNVATASATQMQTHEEKVLAAIQATIEGRASVDMNQYTVGGRHVTKMTLDELLRCQGIYKAKVFKQRNRKKSHPTHGTRFRNPSGGTASDRQWEGQQ